MISLKYTLPPLPFCAQASQSVALKGSFIHKIILGCGAGEERLTDVCALAPSLWYAASTLV